jgi:hypothetical protein
MITQAAAFRSVGAPLSIAPITRAPPHAREVQVKIKAVGLCRTDLHVMRGERRVAMAPRVLGHEAQVAPGKAGPSLRQFHSLESRAKHCENIALFPGRLVAIRLSAALVAAFCEECVSMNKKESHCAGFAGALPRRRWMRPLLAAAVIGVLFGHSVDAHAGTARSHAHVYLMRGVLNIFSLGLDEIAGKLRRLGIEATVTNYLYWASVADEAAADYKSGRARTIILVGHSSGATVLPDMVERLDKARVPVRLVIGLDSVFKTTLSGRVGRYINFYIADGAGERVKRGKHLRGELENVDVEKIPGIGHISIDKNQIIQGKVIRAIEAVAR